MFDSLLKEQRWWSKNFDNFPSPVEVSTKTPIMVPPFVARLASLQPTDWLGATFVERLVLITLIIMGVTQLHKLADRSEDFKAEAHLAEVAKMLTSLKATVEGKRFHLRSAPQSDFGARRIT